MTRHRTMDMQDNLYVCMCVYFSITVYQSRRQRAVRIMLIEIAMCFILIWPTVTSNITTSACAEPCSQQTDMVDVSPQEYTEYSLIPETTLPSKKSFSPYDFVEYARPIILVIVPVGNILSMLVMLIPHNHRISCCVYMAALAVSDCLVLVIACYYWIVTQIKPFSDLECKIIGYVVVVGNFLSLFAVLPQLHF